MLTKKTLVLKVYMNTRALKTTNSMTIGDRTYDHMIKEIQLGSVEKRPIGGKVGNLSGVTCH